MQEGLSANQEKILRLQERIKSYERPADTEQHCEPAEAKPEISTFLNHSRSNPNPFIVKPKSPSNVRRPMNLQRSEQLEQSGYSGHQLFEKSPPVTFFRSPPPMIENATEAKFFNLEERMFEKLQVQNTVCDNFNDQIHVLLEEAKKVKRELLYWNDKNEEKFMAFQRTLNEEMNEVIEETKKIKKDIIDSIEKKQRAIKHETMAVIANSFEQDCRNSMQEINSQLAGLKEHCAGDQMRFDEAVENMMTSFGAEILNLEENVKNEKKLSAERSDLIGRAMAKMEQDYRNRIFKEQKEAKEQMGNLQRMLQQACFRIEMHLLK